MKKMIRYNMTLMLRQKGFWISMGLMLLTAMAIPLYYTIKNVGEYRYNLPSADTLFLFSGGTVWWYAFSFAFPILIILPYGLSFVTEKSIGVNIYLQSRSDRTSYYYAQMLTCFIGMTVIIFIPSMLNILLDAIIFPINGNDYISTYHAYDDNWVNTILDSGCSKLSPSSGYLWKSLAVNHPMAYNVFYSVWTSLMAGIMSAASYALSVWMNERAIRLMIANYLIFSICKTMNNIAEESDAIPFFINFDPAAYLANGHFNTGLYYPFFIGLMIAVIVASCIIIRKRITGDEL